MRREMRVAELRSRRAFRATVSNGELLFDEIGGRSNPQVVL